MAHYPIELTPDDDGTFLVTSRRLPEVTTFGADREQALSAAARAVEEALAARIARGDDVPAWSSYGRVGSDVVVLPTLTALKVSLHRVLLQRGCTRAELARRLGWHREQVDRLFRLGHASRLDQIDAAFQALGCPPVEIADPAQTESAA